MTDLQTQNETESDDSISWDSESSETSEQIDDSLLDDETAQVNGMDVDGSTNDTSESRLAKRSLEGASKSNTPEEKVRKVESEMSRQQTTPQSEIHVDNQMPEPGRVGSPPFLPGQSADVPDRPKLRGYQEEMSQKILAGQNDLIVLPTGSGKTNIAANLVLHHLQKHQAAGDQATKCKVLFLAPRVAIVDQNYKRIRKYLGLNWEHTCTKVTGGTIENLDHLKEILSGDDYKMVAATPQTIVNYLQGFEQNTSIKDFSLIIFDEVHHSNGKGAPYDLLMKSYVTEKVSNPESAHLLPQIVGLTATVGVGKKSKNAFDAECYIMSLCASMGLKHPPTEVKGEANIHELDLLRNPQEKDIEHVRQDRGDKFSDYIKEVIMKEIISDVKEKLSSIDDLKPCAKIFNPGVNFLLPAFGSCVTNTENSLSAVNIEGNSPTAELKRQSLVMIHHLMIYHEALKFTSLVTCKEALSYIEEEFSDAVHQTVDCYRKYEEEWRGRLTELETTEYPNKKLTILKKRIDQILQTGRIDENFSPRIIIFVQPRLLARMISEWLNNQSENYRSRRFVSQNASNDKDVMTKNEADTVMEQFRNGELNILVSTSVLSEGIDVPECNGVITYMFTSDVIADVQIPGRVRAADGKFVAIVDEERFNKIVANRPKERWMTESLTKIRGKDQIPFSQLIAEDQKRIHREVTEARTQSMKATNLCSVASIKCRMCSRVIGSLSNLYQYLGHYLNLDPDLKSKVKDPSDDLMDTSEPPIDGITEHNWLECKGAAGASHICSNKFGKLCIIKINGEKRRLAKWEIKAIKFISEDQRISRSNPKTFAEVAKVFKIKELKHEEFRDLVTNFPIQP